MNRTVSLLFILAASALALHTTTADDVVVPVLGNVVFDDAVYEKKNSPESAWRPVAPCWANDPPVIAFGNRGIGGSEAHGDLRGRIEGLGATIDGVRLTGVTLPTGSFFRYLLHDNGGAGCKAGSTCGSDRPDCENVWTIGHTSGAWGTGEIGGTVYLDIPAIATVGGLGFSFKLCNREMSWGAGCNVVETVTPGWELRVPGPVEAIELADGNPPSHRFPESRVTVDLDTSSGGVLMVTSVQGNPPFPSPDLVIMPQYWELRTDMVPGSYHGKIRVGYDHATVPPEIVESRMQLWFFDPDLDQWQPLETSVDPSSPTVAATFSKSPLIIVLGVVVEQGPPAAPTGLIVQ